MMTLVTERKIKNKATNLLQQRQILGMQVIIAKKQKLQKTALAGVGQVMEHRVIF